LSGCDDDGPSFVDKDTVKQVEKARPFKVADVIRSSTVQTFTLCHNSSAYLPLDTSAVCAGAG
jgi:hypothetical protein